MQEVRQSLARHCNPCHFRRLDFYIKTIFAITPTHIRDFSRVNFTNRIENKEVQLLIAQHKRRIIAIENEQTILYF